MHGLSHSERDVARGRNTGWEKHLKRAVRFFFFLSWVGGRNLPLEKLILEPPDAFKIKNNGPHDKPSAAFTTKEMPDVFFQPDKSFHALLCYVELGFYCQNRGISCWIILKRAKRPRGPQVLVSFKISVNRTVPEKLHIFQHYHCRDTITAEAVCLCLGKQGNSSSFPLWC